ncbi:hypothetical protein [Sphingobium vermicomposti]|uniref:Alpha/beta hydrolase n=1 Tax=Sphingobium vermicomposti TaxID=529005 RepID=A0A846MCY4_9SPHN|nr:hypothetical protein [Sphingobium vermicomposti]NIJ15635.1 hypothetical protein [Sphingobium vermicomposti]
MAFPSKKILDTDELIFETDNLSVVFTRAAKKVASREGTVVCTFCALLDESAPRFPTAQASLSMNGLDAVHFLPRGNQWYQYAEIDGAAEKARSILSGYDNVVSTGASMGGYAAVHTSAALNADRVVALAPQFTVDPKKVNYNPGWGNTAAKIDFVRDDFERNVKKGATYIAVYDPRLPVDRNHAAELEKRLPINKLILPFGRHHVGIRLREAQLMPKALIDMLTGEGDLASIRRDFRKVRSTLLHYWLGIAERHASLRALALEKARAFDPQNPNEVKLIADLAKKSSAHPISTPSKKVLSSTTIV